MPASNLTPFAFGDALVRIVADEHGDPLFIAKDVALALGYAWNGMKNLQHIPEEWRGVESVSTPSGMQEMHTLAEQGLYFFLGRSDKPKALPFQKWLAGEVLPAIRKTGGYQVPRVEAPELPVDVSRLRPQLRAHVLNASMQAARLLGVGTQEGIDALFLHYCRLVAQAPAGSPARLPGMPFSHALEEEHIQRFAHECLEPQPGGRLHAGDLYHAFCRWWRECFDAAPPTQRVFGRVIVGLYPRRKANHIYYYHVAFRERNERPQTRKNP